MWYKLQDYKGEVIEVRRFSGFNLIFIKPQDKKETRKFWAFDALKTTSDKLREGDLILLRYREVVKVLEGKVQIFDKINDLEVISSKAIENSYKTTRMTITGTIKNINNFRGYAAKNEDEVCFTLKQCKHTRYCYMHKALTNSYWFNKDTEVMLEAEPLGEVANHEAFRIYSIWFK